MKTVKTLYRVMAVVVLFGSAALAQQDAGLKQLAERLLGPWGDPGEQRLSLEPGTLPSEVAAAIPLPENTTIVGSLVRRHADGRLQNAQMVLDVPLSTQDAMQFFKTELAARGWTSQHDFPVKGFVPPQANLWGMMCTPTGDAYMYQNVYFVRGKPADVRLDYNVSEDYSPCLDSGYYGHNEVPLPMLAAPGGSEVFQLGQAEYGEQGSSNAIIQSELSSAALLEHYEEQLTALGWQKLEPDVTEGVYLSRWQLESEDADAWYGLLSVNRLHEDGQHFASFTLIRDTAEVSEPQG